jgi:hypothetical protein
LSLSTGVNLEKFIKSGSGLWQRSESGDGEFTKSSLLQRLINHDAVALVRKAASLPPQEIPHVPCNRT